MTIRRLLLASLLLSGAASAAGLERYKGWNGSPEFVLLSTDAEQKEWKAVASDADAERFVELFWARRDPDLSTPGNELEAAFARRVKEADQLFALPRLRGALTERGKLYVLVGPPKTLRRIPGTRPPPMRPPGAGAFAPLPPPNDPGTSMGEQIAVFVYEAQQLPEWTGLKSLQATFVVEASRDYVSGRSDGSVHQIEASARTSAIKSPDLKEAPRPRAPLDSAAQRPGPAAAGAPAAPAAPVAGPALDPSVKTALEELLGKEDTGLLTVTPLANRAGEGRLHAQLYVPGGAGPIPPGTRFAVLVRDGAGQEVARYEGVAEVESAAGGSFVGRAFTLAAGTYFVAAGLFDPTGKAVASARRSTTVTPAPAEFGLGPLVVAATLVPAPAAKPDEAFVFSGHRFYSKAGQLDAVDGLAFVVRVYNPEPDPATKAAKLSRTVKIKPPGQVAIEVPQPVDGPIPLPERKDGADIVAVDLAVSLVETELGQYFRRPGDYLLVLTVTDEVGKKSAEARATFTITGTLPPKT